MPIETKKYPRPINIAIRWGMLLPICYAIFFLMVVSSCGGEARRDVDERFIDKNLHTKICDGSKISQSNEASPFYLMSWDLFIIDFPRKRCLTEFYDSLELNSLSYEPIDGTSYSRAIGVSRDKSIKFMIGRLDDKRVTFSVSK